MLTTAVGNSSTKDDDLIRLMMRRKVTISSTKFFFHNFDQWCRFRQIHRKRACETAPLASQPYANDVTVIASWLIETAHCNILCWIDFSCTSWTMTPVANPFSTSCSISCKKEVSNFICIFQLICIVDHYLEITWDWAYLQCSLNGYVNI